MKPFNLEEAKAGKKVVTRLGTPVEQFTIITDDHCTFIFGVVGGVKRDWLPNGRFYTATRDSDLDIFMATEKKTVWIPFFQHSTSGKIETSEKTFENKDDVEVNETATIWKHIGTYSIEIEM